MPHPPISVRLSDRTYAILSARALADNRSVGQLIRELAEKGAADLRRAQIRAESEAVSARYQSDPNLRDFYDVAGEALLTSDFRACEGKRPLPRIFAKWVPATIWTTNLKRAPNVGEQRRGRAWFVLRTQTVTTRTMQRRPLRIAWPW